MNPFQYSDDNKRYHTLSYYNRQHGIPSYKAVIDAGFTCPNIDGKKGLGGCIYCDGGSGYFTAVPAVPIRVQVDREIDRIRKNHPYAQAIAYFQAHTNTYAPVDVLIDLFETALAHDGIIGISIATRADTLPKDILDYLTELSHRTRLTIELGLQTVHNATAAAINRCHSFDDFMDGYSALKTRGLRTCIHLINGLPGEDAHGMIESAQILGKLRPDAVKLHLLHVIRGTVLESMYKDELYIPMSLTEYVEVIVRQLEVLPPQTVIERITGDGDKRTMVAPSWSMDKIKVLGSIDKRIAQLNTWQGRLFSSFS